MCFKLAVMHIAILLLYIMQEVCQTDPDGFMHVIAFMHVLASCQLEVAAMQFACPFQCNGKRRMAHPGQGSILY